jgi:transcriptional regulator with XRE-family HTH domain
MNDSLLECDVMSEMNSNSHGVQAEQLNNIGKKVRDARLAKNLSLREVSRRTGLTPSLISQVERGVTCPSVSSLLSIASVLELPMQYFFESDHLRPVSEQRELEQDAYVRKEEGEEHEEEEVSPIILSPPRVSEQSPAVAWDIVPVVPPGEREILKVTKGVQWERLTPKHDNTIEFITLNYEVGSSSGDVAYSHRGREYGVVLQGKLELELGFNTYILEPGWSVSFDCSIPHRLVNAGDTSMTGIWVVVDRY